MNLAEMWNPALARSLPSTISASYNHRASGDIQSSIAVLRWYKESAHLFSPTPPTPAQSGLHRDAAAEKGGNYKQDVQAAWAGAAKTSGGRVARDAFKQAMLRLHRSKLSDGSAASYASFLDRCFDAGTGLMLPAEKQDLGRHCFSYAALIAGEFYFAAAQNAHAKDSGELCSCTTPVADVLSLNE